MKSYHRVKEESRKMYTLVVHVPYMGDVFTVAATVAPSVCVLSYATRSVTSRAYALVR